MCGIIGYTGPRPAAPILLDSLRRLEYRGYDSAGIAIIDADGDVATVKNTNKVADLSRQVEAEGTPSGTVGIGHTRWATHGRPSLENAHPHMDCTGRIHVIHNGIVENYRELRAELMARGHEFLSETDTEVVPHLIEDAFHGDLASAVRTALNRMQGACALVVISADQPDRVVGARMNAPLVVGLGRGEVFVSSDITALIPYTKRIALLGEGEIVTATPDGITVQQLDGTAVEARIVTVDWEAEQAQKNGYPHFLLKEIHEQPEAMRNALRGRIDDMGMVVLPELGMTRSGSRTCARWCSSRAVRRGMPRWSPATQSSISPRSAARSRPRASSVTERRSSTSIRWSLPCRSRARPPTRSPRCVRHDARGRRSSRSPMWWAARSRSRRTAPCTCRPVRRSPSPAPRRS